MDADVILQRRLPRSLGTFTYSVPPECAQQVSVGSWVMVPFRASQFPGVVWSLHPRKPGLPTAIRPIAQTLDVPPLPAPYRSLMEEFARTFGVSLSHALDTLAPAPARRHVSSRLETESAVPALRLTPALAATVRQVQRAVLRARRDEPERTQFVETPTFATRIALLLSLLRAETNRPQLLVEPTHADVLRVVPYLRAQFGNRVHVLHGDLAAGALWFGWHAAAARRDVILVATRRGVFAPLPDLAAVYVDQETDPNHKQEDMNPRYDVRPLALRLAKLFGAQAVLLDRVPSLELVGRRAVQQQSALQVPFRRVLVDMQQERAGRNFAPLAETVIEALQQPGPHLVFQNRRGNVRALRCRDCEWTLRCKECTIPAIELSGALHCPRCGARPYVPDRCPVCHGARLVGSGWGTERLEHYLKSLFPARRIARVDRDRPQAPPLEAEILVATEQLLSRPFPPRVHHLVIASLDSLLQQPDFATAEYAYQLVERLAALLMPRGTIFLQTLAPESAFAGQLARAAYTAFARDELSVRRMLRVPPAATVVKLFVKRRARRDAEREALSAVQILRRKFRAAPSVHVSMPHVPLRDPERGWYRRTIFLTLLPGAAPSGTLQFVLRALPEFWLVDVSPRTLAP